MYRITPEAAKRRVIVEFIDEYADIDQAQLSRDLRAAMLKVKGSGDHFDLLVDYTRTHVMPQADTDNGRREIEWCIANGLRKSANVMNSAIVKMQIQRLTADDRFRMFASHADALAWLDDRE